MVYTVSAEIGGKTLTIETGRVARQANGSCWVRIGDTIVHSAATMSALPREGIDFFPLVVDYEERKYAVGKIPGGFIKRGGKPSDRAILTSRMIDRPLRPLFPNGMRNEVQVISMPLSVEQDNPPDVLAINAASAALTISDIPFNGPVGAIRVSRNESGLIPFPSTTEIEQSDLDLVVVGTKDNVIMIEAGATDVTEADMLAAINFGHELIKKIVELQENFQKEVGKPKTEVALISVDEEIYNKVSESSTDEIKNAIQNPDKAARENALSLLKASIVERLSPEFEEDKISMLGEAVEKIIKREIRKLILDEKRRPDGRGLTEIRPISCEVGLLPRVHGSGLFSRGQTQVLSTITLGTADDAQVMDGIEEQEDKRYMHFYNFPPYSVGEVRPMRGPGRREVGHGALAERALRSVIPTQEEFPYTILVTSEVMESNGSTSMASVCGSTLGLLDAGVPIKEPVAGIAMGLVTDADRYAVLTDIQGMEDFTGDMDFKVAGTRKGINALQLDTKITGIPNDVLIEALAQARDARMYILDKIAEVMPAPREEMSPFAPRIYTIEINPDKIGKVIGPSGATIRKITAETNTKIDIENDGKVFIAAIDKESADAARLMIEGLTKEVEIGGVYEGTVTRLMPRGAFVEVIPGKDGLVTVEQLTDKRIRRPEDVVKIGDRITVRVIEIDNMGRVNLTARGLEQTLETLQGGGSAHNNENEGFNDRRSGGGRGRFDSPREHREPRGERSNPFSREETFDETPNARFRPKR